MGWSGAWLASADLLTTDRSVLRRTVTPLLAALPGHSGLNPTRHPPDLLDAGGPIIAPALQASEQRA